MAYETPKDSPLVTVDEQADYGQTIILVPLKKLKGRQKNPRKITDTDMEALVLSLLKFYKMLHKRPIVAVTDGEFYVGLGGNQRIKALNKINQILKDYKKGLPAPEFIVNAGIDLFDFSPIEKVPILLADDWSDEEKEEFVIRDNVSAGTWDWQELQASYDIEILKSYGIQNIEWENAFEEKEAVEDDYEEKDVVPTDIVLGDVIEIGSHRLICGDSRDSDLVSKLMNGKMADVVFTDPPYGIAYGGARSQLLAKKAYGMVENDDLSGEQLSELLSNVFIFTSNVADVYICVSPTNQKPFLDFIEDSNKTVNTVIVWDKKSSGLGYMKYRRQCEFIIYIKGGDFHIGDDSDIDLWSIGKDATGSYKHGTQKPVAVPFRALKNSANAGDICLDLFLGSGSTMLAAEQLGISCYGMELEPMFCQVTINRMLAYDESLPVTINGKPYRLV